MILFLAAQRFPPPEFSETGHKLPGFNTPLPRGPWLEHLDVIVLLAALALAAWLALRRRSRRGLVALGIFSLLYFGFWRKGCICSIGSIQNMAQGLADSSFGVPATVLAFGLAPLVFALLFGRVFCSAVCPHGALQDLMLIKPVRVPVWLEHGLRLIPYIYLGLALVFAATGGGYIICQYDPFVTIFRLSGSVLMVACGIGLLVLGMFVGRPYCRFLCPYGVLLGFASSVSKWRVRITPDTCTQCRLCEQSCPFDAINKSTIDAPSRSMTTDKRLLAAMILLLPVLLIAGGLLGGVTGKNLARKHRIVNLAERVYLEETGKESGTTDASAAFRVTGEPVENLYADARTVRDRYVLAGRLCGLWIALVIGGKLIMLAIRRKRHDYEADQTRCLACARCFTDCPQELQRLGLSVPEGVPLAPPL
ncbi:MAG: 4Fe-4S binding protein [Methylacidiphilales bacterium]|nr:4Fe-4S binding protein [Candidatus Methylacidiphilales bacterium]